MRPCCSHATAVGDALHERAERHVEPAARCGRRPSTRYRGAGRTGVGSSRSMREERLEDVADRLAKALRGVLHARIEPRETAVPRRARGGRAGDRRGARPPWSTTITTASREQEHERGVRGLAVRERDEQPPRRDAVGRADSRKLHAVTSASAATTCVGNRPSATQPAASHSKPEPLQPAASCASAERGLARLAEEDDAEELDHDVSGQRGGTARRRPRRAAAAC